ncbi:hypothetical protein D0Z03_001498 [Geotrichum reessii]|nr:hypothetical protein D0Z03_001498 [Galactomyces reessii]
MTVGKDVSALFPDVLKNIATPDLDQKKLVYLYLMNYAKSHPELCILAVNTFVQDSTDPNPLVRALAIRTMGCIRVDKMVDYMEIPLRKTLTDENPYVRKTAAICVAKLFDLNPELCVEQGFLEMLKNMLDDSNPMVVANTVSALAEIQESDPNTECFIITTLTLNKLLVALNECTEWGRIAILTALAQYKTTDEKEAGHIIERVIPQFQHANPSVVLAAIKAVIAHIEIQASAQKTLLLKKMGPPLVTLVSSAPEVQYVALRNIQIILQKYPSILSRELRVFFCKYNDPPYLKMEKLEILVSIANASNYEQLLSELKEYSLEVDMDFVRRSIKAIGQVAIKIEAAAQKCVNVLLDLLDNKANYVVQEVVVVVKDILRKYKHFDAAIPALCQNMDDFDEPEARAAIVWIMGEYAEKIENAGDILNTFVSGFIDEATQVQLQLLTACVKLYIKQPESGQKLIQSVLQTATTKSDNADVRDRGYIYWRLLSSDTAIAKDVILSEKPPITTTIEAIPTGLLNELLSELSTLASVYHKPVSSFMGSGRFGAAAVQKRAIEEQKQLAKEDIAIGGPKAGGENLLDLEFDSSESTPTTNAPSSNGLADLTDIFSAPSPPPVGGTSGGETNKNDILSLFGNTSTPPPQANFNGLDTSFGSMNLSETTSGNQPLSQKPAKKATNEDLLSLF